MLDHGTTDDEQQITRQPNRRKGRHSMVATVHNELEGHGRIYLEKLRLAADVILQLGDDPGAIPDSLETELWIFRDRIEHDLLQLPRAGAGILSW